MKLTALTCIYEKPMPVVRAVVGALHDGGADQIIAVFDRPSSEILVQAEWLTPIAIKGPPGWRSPCLSWNAGLKHVTGDHLLIIQGDIVLNPGSVQHARQLLEEHPAAYFGLVSESDPTRCIGPGHAGPILCSSARPRALTYLLAVHAAAVRAIGGWDEAFQAGAWYEDDDFTIRLWKHGLDFIFDDRISGIHQTHDRFYAQPIAIATNQSIFLGKHGTADFWGREAAKGKLIIERQPSRTIWRHT